jgi:hypothetical protein
VQQSVEDRGGERFVAERLGPLETALLPVMMVDARCSGG